MSAVNEASIE